MTGLLFVGFLLGMRHTLEADHLAAVAALSSDTNSVKKAVHQGIVWGIGHTVALFLFCSLVLLFNSIIPENLANELEFAVGIMLLFLGADVLIKLYKRRVHYHVHKHAGTGAHFHAHSHDAKVKHSESAHKHQHSSDFPYRTLFVGIMHGMAGSAALILLTLEQAHGFTEGLLYILIFGMGSILGMATLSVIIAVPFRQSAKKLTWLHNCLQLATGVITMSLGILISIDGRFFNLF